MFDILSLRTAVHAASFPASVHLFPTSLRSGFKVCLFQSRGGLKLVGRCSAAEMVRWKPLLKTSGRAWGGCWHSGACPHAVLSICPCPVPRGGGGQTPGGPILHETQITPDEERWSLAKYSYPPLSVNQEIFWVIWDLPRKAFKSLSENTVAFDMQCVISQTFLF